MTIDSLRNARVLVTGGEGFLGRHLVRVLEEYGAEVAVPCRHLPFPERVDLTQWERTDAMFDNAGRWGCDYVFHLAGFNGGIQFNRDYPADIFYRNTLMGLNVLEACKQAGVKKVVSVVASCAYPENVWVDDEDSDTEGVYHSTCQPRDVMVETAFLDGPPHNSVSCHGYAKRNLQLASSFYRQQYGLMAVCACPTTLYGPGDSFEPARTKVMGGMVKRFVDAVDEGQKEVVCWGSGAARREFLYIEDAARLLVHTMLHYEDSGLPLNLGTGQELSIRQVAETVASCVKFEGNILWDTTKPDGQRRKRLDLTRMQQVIPSYSITGLEDGIKRTAEYYRGLKEQRVAA